MNRKLKAFLALFGGNPWEYGTCGQDARHSRRHILSGNVQFILWPKGTQNHFEDYWHTYDSSWFPTWELGPVASYEYGMWNNTLARRHKETKAVYYTDYNHKWCPTTPDIAAQFKLGFK